MKKELLLVMLIFLSGMMTFAQQNLPSHTDIPKKLEDWASIFPQEKVYLHTDKPYYAIGDTIWFKAYVVIGSRNKLSALSGAIYVDLITDTDSLINTLKLPLINGLAKGNFNLTSKLPEGNYRLRAYTQWMRNSDSDYFYDHTFTVGRVLSEARISASAQFSQGSDGKMKIAIKYVDKDGIPIANKEVKYRWSQDASDKTKYLKTNDQGMLILYERFSNDELKKNPYLETRITQEKGKYSYKNIPLKEQANTADIQFFPEGGILVNGLSNRIALKATGTNGLGLAMSGKITDTENNEICNFESTHFGMGSFLLKPEAGKQYYAVVNLPNDETKKIPLPIASNKETGLAVYNNFGRDTLLVRVLAPAVIYEQGAKNFQLLIQRGEEILEFATVKISKALSSIRIPTNDFPTGIIKVTLFDATNQPVNERIFFKRKDGIAINISSDKEAYAIKEKVVIKLQSSNDLAKGQTGNFSVSVINESQTPVNETAESSILSQLLLSSDLKGYVEAPNSYFLKNDEETTDNLDLLMMTQGYRRFAWKEVLSEKVTKPEYPAEKLTTKIAGHMMNFGDKPIIGGKVSLSSIGAGINQDVITDASGYFDFGDILLSDSVKFTISGAKPNKGKKVEIILDQINPLRNITANKNLPNLQLDVQETLKTYLAETKVSHLAMKKMGLGQTFELDEVEIKGKKNSLDNSLSYNLNGAGRADQTLKGADLIGCPTLRTCLEGRLVGVIFKPKQLPNVGMVLLPFSTRDAKSENPMMVVINGRNLNPSDGADAMDIADIFDGSMIPPSEIESIEVLRTPSLTGVYGTSGMNGVIVINAKRWTPSSGKNYSVFYAPKGFNKVREFYEPRYDRPTLPVIDERTTIYWNPAILTDNSGNATFDFFNSTKPGKYKVLIEGIDASGNLGRGIYRYQVQ